MPASWNAKLEPLTNKVQNALFHVSGYLLDSIMESIIVDLSVWVNAAIILIIIFQILQGLQVTCPECFDGLIADKKYKALYTAYTAEREYKEGLLIYVTPEAFEWFKHLEQRYSKQ